MCSCFEIYNLNIRCYRRHIIDTLTIDILLNLKNVHICEQYILVRDVNDACDATTICGDPNSACVSDVCTCNGPTYIDNGAGGCRERK